MTTYYLAVSHARTDLAKGFVASGGGMTNDVRAARPFSSFDQADQFAKAAGFRAYAILCPA